MAYKPETVLSTPSRRQIYSTFNLCRGNDVCINSVNNQTRLMRTSEISSFEYIAATPRVRLGNSSFVTHDTLASKSKMSEDVAEKIFKTMDETVMDQQFKRQQMFSKFCLEASSLLEKLRNTFHTVTKTEAELQELLGCQDALLQKLITSQSRAILAFQNLFERYISGCQQIDNTYETNKTDLLNDVSREVQKLTPNTSESHQLTGPIRALTNH